MMLGSGQEGVVTLVNGQVYKRFHPGKPADSHIPWLQVALSGAMPHLPEPVWTKDGIHWCAQYPWFESQPADFLSLAELRNYFCFCLERNIVTPNIKRANFRRRADGLTFVDVGGDILPMNADFFRDACARGFVLAELGWTDADLLQHSKALRAESMLQSLPGFGDFYSSIFHEHARRQWALGAIPDWPTFEAVAPSVTLLIKACAMDAGYLSIQVRHIVGQLQSPRRFAERLLVIDPFQGPYLREHCSGDWARLLEDAEQLRASGWLDRVLIAPGDPHFAQDINRRWFQVDCPHTHCARGIPVVPQLWGFEQVRTRFVLQCDADVLIGRRDLAHDYLEDMLQAAGAPNALGVAFSIPRAPSSPFLWYSAPPGDFVPEVRCGLLDLDRIRTCLPLPNSLAGERLAHTWYRSLQLHQKKYGLCTLRGGDSRTFYVHPPNSWKNDQELLDRVRDLVSQGLVPAIQFGKWDLSGSPVDWRYEMRREEIVFIVKGRNTSPAKIERCLRSLAMQDDQRFGIILIDDASLDGSAPALPHLLQVFLGRYTLVRRSRHHGYMPNTLLAVREIISDLESLAVVLDLDDALLHRSAVAKLLQCKNEGAEVLTGAMFRPDKPLKLYHPNFIEPRKKWGGEVWIHLRSFRKRLFHSLEIDDLKLKGEWIPFCEDYATMIPLVELSSNSVHIPEYLYFHERSANISRELRKHKNDIIRQIIAKPKRHISGCS